jgi:2-C-methyl-D-erythritol 4-phosphate cytidylyltransferase
MNRYAIIVAGGSGKRFGSQTPKQFTTLKGIPVLMRTIQAFHDFDNALHIIVVLPSENAEFWKSLCNEYNFQIKHKIVTGGQTRFHSVSNGLSEINGTGIVGIHDAVRPLVSQETLSRCYNVAIELGNAIPAIELVDSIRQITSNTSVQVNRDSYRLIQTPQVFNVNIIKKAFEQNYTPEFTDDASVLEKAGYEVNLVEGNRENIKITTQTDMIVAEAFIEKLNFASKHT